MTLRCPVCGLGGYVRAVTLVPTITCNHHGTPHDAKRNALMVRIPDEQQGAA